MNYTIWDHGSGCTSLVPGDSPVADEGGMPLEKKNKLLATLVNYSEESANARYKEVIHERAMSRLHRHGLFHGFLIGATYAACSHFSLSQAPTVTVAIASFIALTMLAISTVYRVSSRV